MVEIGLARIDRHDRDPVLSKNGVAVPEHLLEVHVADVSRVVVSGNHDDRLAIQPIHVLASSQVFVAEAEGRQITRAHDDVRLQLVDLPDRTLQQADLEVRPTAVQIGDLCDPKGVCRARHALILGGERRPSRSVLW